MIFFNVSSFGSMNWKWFPIKSLFTMLQFQILPQLHSLPSDTLSQLLEENL